ncbi:hypothetical protein Ping_0205 [Psychromonas ingrahamii 37]|uniref:DUF4124 domain-containing protein n=1 Tax=Psychromonas ingrahamii (strain DSM 17664 / CCUG 51855 / 37) TaxID=357804 RepID=A1SRF7_PSYIN|nr:DUF4124 domain-containing protein [Psychromonas ingrahamii]ABM02072.1 hypothetical protein Ping_0205 [Psychromonas ingrahamii 37]
MPSVIILLTFLFSCSVSADIYTWQDAGGVTHFSEKKPAQAFKTIASDFNHHKTYQQGVKISYDVEALTPQTASVENAGLNVQTDLIKESQQRQK